MNSTDRSPSARRWRRSIAATLAVAAMVAAGCGSSKSTKATPPGGTTSGTAAQAASGSKAPIVIAGLQGTAAQGGQDFIEGMLIAEKQINSSGGIDGRQVKVNVIQTQGTSEGAVAAYQQAAQDSSTIGAFLGATGGIAIRAQSDLVKLPVILANGTDSDVFPVKKYVFANDQGHENSTASLRYAVTTLHAKTVAVLHYNTDFSEQIAGYVQAGCKELGCTVTDIEAAGATDSQQQLIPLLQKMKNSNPDVYYIESVNPNGMAAAQQLGMFSKPVIAEQWLTVPAIQQACATNCDGVVFGGHKCTDPSLLPSSDPYVKLCNDYINLFQQSYPGQPFALFSIYGYAAVHTLAEAARRTLSSGHALTRDAVVTQLEGFHGDFQTLLGNLKTSSSNHLLTGKFQEAYVLYTIKAASNGKATWALAPNSDPEVGAVG
ncbi:MAG TPA: ABC transporter substrate-binding protein [Acidimicrobiales bacterium]|nr:ABC transporter substrate-binding protein [Acidimicrobiales bacterium]